MYINKSSAQEMSARDPGVALDAQNFLAEIASQSKAVLEAISFLLRELFPDFPNKVPHSNPALKQKSNILKMRMLF